MHDDSETPTAVPDNLRRSTVLLSLQFNVEVIIELAQAADNRI